MQIFKQSHFLCEIRDVVSSPQSPHFLCEVFWTPCALIWYLRSTSLSYDWQACGITLSDRQMKGICIVAGWIFVSAGGISTSWIAWCDTELITFFERNCFLSHAGVKNSMIYLNVKCQAQCECIWGVWSHVWVQHGRTHVHTGPTARGCRSGLISVTVTLIGPCVLWLCVSLEYPAEPQSPRLPFTLPASPHPLSVLSLSSHHTSTPDTQRACFSSCFNVRFYPPSHMWCSAVGEVQHGMNTGSKSKIKCHILWH